MAARVLDDVLNSSLTVDSLMEWLSNDKIVMEKEVLFKNYDCRPVQFVSYFLTYLREQTSRNFQVYDAETPRKTLSCRNIKNTNALTDKSSLLVKSDLNSSMAVNDLDLESLQSFPSLSSCSSFKLAESTEKLTSDFTPDNTVPEDRLSSNREEKRTTRVKLFSETLEGNIKGSHHLRKRDLEFWDESDASYINRFAISTPKPLFKSSPLHSSDYFNSSDIAQELPKSTNKSHWIALNHDASSPDMTPTVSKSKSFTANSSHKNKDNNKTNSRMSLGDFILTDVSGSENKKEKKTKPKKRINTIRVANTVCLQEKLQHFLYSSTTVEPAATANVNSAEAPQLGENSQRRQCTHPKDQTSPMGTSQSVPSRQPVLELISHTNQLNTLSKIYSYLINENYCQNIMIELCFIVSLLVIQDSDKKVPQTELSTVTGGKIFTSIDNCVYFAVEMLWLQKNCLLNLNLSALKLLSENPRVEKFNQNLRDFLLDAYAQSQSIEEFKRQHGFIKTAMQGNVSFQYETDNRENFTSDLCFHSFKKQRDLFYNILAIWEANHSVSGWVFAVGLGSKIRSLLAISSDPINLLHLARLFRNQLITSCCGENQAEGELNEKILQLLPSADPNKILRLRARLTSSPKRQGPCPLPDFTGHQEFYKDFILYTSHSVFHQHLKNSLCDEILRLNETDLIGDCEEEESSLDELAEERYLQCVNILRLLAKFLGFLEFMPYRGEKAFSERISNLHCSVRNYVLPLFDINSCLQTAVKKQTLILTVPWIVSYLSMIDAYSARLKIYQNVWRLLIVIYKCLKTLKNDRNRFYLKLTLGWIFQLPTFPSDQFYSVLDDYRKSADENLQLSEPFDNSCPTALDSKNLIQDSVLYAVCPYLNEINVILSENSGCNVRHIRPVTTQENCFTKSQASKQLQLRLESNFLHNQSSSTRKTVEFVTERIASITIKHLIYKTIPKIRESYSTELDKLQARDLKEAETAAEVLSEACFKELLSACQKENREIGLKRSEIAVKALLSNDLQPSVADTCTKIAARQAMEKTERWMQSHVTLAMTKKEFVSAARKRWARKVPEATPGNPDPGDHVSKQHPPLKLSYNLPVPGTERLDHRDSAWPASRAIKAAKESICLTREGRASPASLELLIEEATRTVCHRSDVIPAAERALMSLLLDLVLMFCVHSTNEDPLQLINKFIILLASVGTGSRCILERIICSRNMSIISKESNNSQRAWENIGNLLLLLLDRNLLEKDHLEAQLLFFFRHPYGKEEGETYAKFIATLRDRYTQTYGLDKFSLLLEYIVETINDDESKADDFT